MTSFCEQVKACNNPVAFNIHMKFSRAGVVLKHFHHAENNAVIAIGYRQIILRGTVAFGIKNTAAHGARDIVLSAAGCTAGVVGIGFIPNAIKLLSIPRSTHIDGINDIAWVIWVPASSAFCYNAHLPLMLLTKTVPIWVSTDITAHRHAVFSAAIFRAEVAYFQHFFSITPAHNFDRKSTPMQAVTSISQHRAIFWA